MPEAYRARRPRPVTIHDDSGLANYNAGWLIEGSLEPHALGPGAQQLFDLIGEDQVLFSSDFPHGEGRGNAALEIIERKDLTENQKKKLLFDNAVRLFGEP